ncbi:MAG: SMP-30/gluconolactonase/LRE family protein [Candidatus Acidiferrales bacterium]
MLSAQMKFQPQFPPSTQCILALAFAAALAHSSAAHGQNATTAQSPQKKEIPPAIVHEITILEAFLANHPDDPAALFNLAIDEATIGENGEALDLLKKMSRAHSGLDPSGGAARSFKDIAKDPRFVAIVEQIRKENPPAVHTTVAYTLRERDLAPEGIAYDPVDKSFYVSSISKHKIVRLAPDGSATDFKSSGQDGLGETLGMNVDAERRYLWVTSAAFTGNPKGSRFALYQYDLNTGALRFKHASANGAEGFLNDVALNSKGEAFTTNTGTGEVFRASPDRDGLEPFLPRDSVGQANGIALSPDDKALFVAGWIGVARVDVASKQFKLLSKPLNISDAGLDGLYFYKGALVGIQNPDLHPSRVVRYVLNPQRDAITSAEVLEAYSPLAELPTTGTIVGDLLYFMGNTQIDKMKQHDAMPPPSELSDIHILKLKL